MSDKATVIVGTGLMFLALGLTFANYNNRFTVVVSLVIGGIGLLMFLWGYSEDKNAKKNALVLGVGIASVAIGAWLDIPVIMVLGGLAAAYGGFGWAMWST